MNQLSDFRSYVENQFTSLQSSIDNLTKRMDDMETKQGEYEAALTFCGEEIADIENKFSGIESLRRDLDALKKSQKEDNSKVTQLQSEKHLKTLQYTAYQRPTTKISHMLSLNSVNRCHAHQSPLQT